MTRRETIFFVVWGLIVFPSLILYLRLKHGLDVPTIQAAFTYMGVVKVAYAGARGFQEWNETPDAPSGNIDDGGH